MRESKHCRRGWHTLIVVAIALTGTTLARAQAPTIGNQEGRYILASLARIEAGLSGCLASSQGILAEAFLANPVISIGHDKQDSSEFKAYFAQYEAMRKDALEKLAKLLTEYNASESGASTEETGTFLRFARDLVTSEGNLDESRAVRQLASVSVADLGLNRLSAHSQHLYDTAILLLAIQNLKTAWPESERLAVEKMSDAEFEKLENEALKEKRQRLSKLQLSVPDEILNFQYYTK